MRKKIGEDKRKNRKGNGKMMRRQIEENWCSKRAVLIAVILVMGIMAGFWPGILVKADDIAVPVEREENGTITECSLIATAVGEVDAKEKPDENAAVIISYHDGDNIYVTGETADGWYRVRYQDLVGYVRIEQAAEIELDVEALNDEFAVEEEEGRLVVEEVERQRTEARRSKIWGAVIILLVLGVFVTGIITTVRSGKDEEGRE